MASVAFNPERLLSAQLHYSNDLTHRFWLGIVDMNSTNQWTYHSNGNLLTWTNWDIDHTDGIQPSNLGDDCTVLFNPDNFEWHDGPCNKLRPSICEYVPKLFDCEGLGSNYRFVLGNCYYFEETESDFANASKNCEDKFGAYGYGKLFEPMNKHLNDKVIQVARNTITSSKNW